jgi:hypothetical protein
MLAGFHLGVPLEKLARIYRRATTRGLRRR